MDYDPSTDTWICPEHGPVNPVKITVLDFGLDDSTGYIRTTLFGDSAAELIGEDPEVIDEKLKKLIDEGLTPKEAGGKRLAEDEYYPLIGKEIVVRGGSVVEDKFLGTLFKARNWDEVNEKAEIERVRKELYRELKEYGLE